LSSAEILSGMALFLSRSGALGRGSGTSYDPEINALQPIKFCASKWAARFQWLQFLNLVTGGILQHSATGQKLT